VKVEVLYVADCPSHPAAVRLVRDVLRKEDVLVEVEELLVANECMARSLRFHGSPTIRINGRDVAEDSPHSRAAFGLSCRLYPGSGTLQLPSAELVRHAVVEARKGGHR
jgi:hypothetical protein